MRPSTFSAPRSRPRLRIGIALVPNFTLTPFSVLIDCLRLAADERDRSRPIDCEWAVLGDEGSITSSCGVRIEPQAPMRDPESFDYIVVVGGIMHGGQRTSRLTAAFLRQAAAGGVPLIGLCTGSFVLTRLGLMDGYQICVSWLHREDFLDEFPSHTPRTDTRFVVDRDRLTCAGGTSVVHLAAMLIEKHVGRVQATKTLRIMIEDTPLPYEAWQPEAVVTRQARDGVVRQAMLLIEESLAEPISLDSLEGSTGLSLRQLERRFQRDVGISPGEYRLRLRLARATWLLEHTTRPVTEIALECGFTDCAHFSNVHRKRTGQRPLDVRRRSSRPDR